MMNNLKSRLTRFLRTVKADSQGMGRITGRKIYIIPTGYGVMFGILLITLLIASINYANNPAFLLTFLLGGIFIQAIFQTWRNLLHIQITQGSCPGVFAGDTAYPVFFLSNPDQRSHYSLQLAFAGQEPVMTDVPGQTGAQISLPVATSRRGRFKPGRLTIESRFPIGLLRAWCYLNAELDILVWPRPLKGALNTRDPDYQATTEGNRGIGTDDFMGNRNYRPGDLASHINWKALAGEKGLLVKEYGGDRQSLLWLDYAGILADDSEYRLQVLAEAVCALSNESACFGLRLPKLEIPPDQGEKHRIRCLDALALFGETQ